MELQISTEGPGSMSASFLVLLTQILNLTENYKATPKFLQDVEQTVMAETLDSVKQQLHKALQSKQTVRKRNEALSTSNYQLLGLIANQVHSYSNTKFENDRWEEIVSSLENSNLELLEELSRFPNNTETVLKRDCSSCSVLECQKLKELAGGLNFTVDEHPIEQKLQPLLAVDEEVTFHVYEPHSPVIVPQKQTTDGTEEQNFITQVPDSQLNASIRNKRASGSSLTSLLLSLYRYNVSTESGSETASTKESVSTDTSSISEGTFVHPEKGQVSVPGLDRNPLRRNEQLQNLNVHLQTILSEVTYEYDKERVNNYNHQQKLMELLTERNDKEKRLIELFTNLTQHYKHLQISFLEMQRNLKKDNTELKPCLNETLQSHQKLEKEKDLLEASKTGNLTAVMYLIRRHTNLSAYDENFFTPLHWAAKNDHLEVVQTLLKAGSDPKAKDINGSTPLHLASANSTQVEMLKLLVESGSRVDSVNKAKDTPLHEAVRSGKVEMVKELLTLGSNITFRNLEDRLPLHEAAVEGSEELVRMFLDSGSEVDARSKNAFTSLHLASLHGHLKVCEELIDRGANVNAVTAERQTPLHLAAMSGHVSVVDLLVQKGANVRARNMRGRTPAGAAARKGQKSIVAYLGRV